MTTPSHPAPRPEPDIAPLLAQVAAGAAPDPAVIGVDFGRDDRWSAAVCSRRDGRLVVHGIRHGRMGFGLGGGLS